MKFTCTDKPDPDGKYHVKVDGIHIGNINEEIHAGNRSVWIWRTKAVEVHNNRTGTSPSLEQAKLDLKASSPILIKR